MKLVNAGPPITEDGAYLIEAEPGDSLLVDVDGVFGTAQALLKWRSSAGNDHSVLDPALQPVGGGEAFVGRIDVPKSGVVVLEVSSSDSSTSLAVGWVSALSRPAMTSPGRVGLA
jgi:hypothetical protein